ncbi:hypothetical protein UPYG_G00339100 [Umbra pygmaea]|uniref:Ig-like domain-containing protein n=1 Tax=Umbra pygmaea TaxID=75934 RepID=A0ABD0W0R7_UMBPY
MKAFILILGVCLFKTVSAVTHSLKYFYTGSTGMEHFPQFVAVGIVDGMQIDYFDSKSEKNVLKQSWMEGVRDEKRITDVRKGHQQSFSNNVGILMQRFNQSTGVHTVQWMYGCEWDDETKATGGFNQYGYDGEDFITFDLKTLTWIATKQQAVISKHKWDSDKAQNEFYNNYFTQECVDWLKKYLDYGRSSLMRTAPPSVSLLQKTPSSPVTCHATGFYPSRVMVTWQKDGQDLHEDVELGETLPNDDGTFQKSVQLNVKPEERKINQYQCVVQVSGIKEDFFRVFTEKEPFPVGIIIGVVAAFLAIIAAVVVVVSLKKNKNKKKSKKVFFAKGFAQANTSETDSDNSGQKP